MLLWKPPVYQGRDEVNGFYIDIKEAEAPFEAWRGVNEKATAKKYMKVSTFLCSYKKSLKALKRLNYIENNILFTIESRGI